MAVEGCARWCSEGLRLAASQHIEGHPEEEVGQHVQVYLGAALSVLENATSVLRPALQLLPAQQKATCCCDPARGNRLHSRAEALSRKAGMYLPPSNASSTCVCVGRRSRGNMNLMSPSASALCIALKSLP